ncbi:MAG: hypothetical protein QM674_12955 [Burkholderiaceae bacterium]
MTPTTAGPVGNWALADRYGMDFGALLHEHEREQRQAQQATHQPSDGYKLLFSANFRSPAICSSS